MQAVTMKNGSRKRLFCLSCMREGKSWLGGELCDHFNLPLEAVGPESRIDPPILARESNISPANDDQP
jgi:hypothetical protein